MWTSNELLNMVKARYGIQSDYELAKKLSVSRGFISEIRRDRSFLGADLSVLTAELLDIDPLKILASTQIERAKKTHNIRSEEIWKAYA